MLKFINQLTELAERLVIENLDPPPLLFWEAFLEALGEPEYPKIGVTQIPCEPRNVVLVSGGLDSTIGYFMWLAQGREPTGLYIDFGQKYKEAELYAMRQLGIHFEEETIALSVENRVGEWAHIIPARNMIALLHAAQKGSNAILFSVVNGESPPRGGDKSDRFITLMDDMLPQRIYTMRERTKAQWVRFAIDQKIMTIEQLLKTYSCFEGTVGVQCGRCQSCLRRYIAFAYNDIPDDEILWNYEVHPLEGCKEAIEKYRKKMRVGNCRYTAQRIKETLAVIGKEDVHA